ncbi:MAG: hypothetical protein RLZZ338_4466 [Cyanobacteriota bacterium]|jgi:Uma2 family endonuclease
MNVAAMTITTAKHFTITEYHRLTEIGFFCEDDRVELIDGGIFEMAAKGVAHETCLRRLLREVNRILGGRATLQCQSPILLPNDSEPEPDFTLVRNRDDDYLSGHPTPGDILLLIEIADSSLSYDKEVKLPVYADAGIAHYWIFNLGRECLECYSEPYQTMKGDFSYRKTVIFLPNETVNLPGFPDLSLDLSKVFPPQ